MKRLCPNKALGQRETSHAVVFCRAPESPSIWEMPAAHRVGLLPGLVDQLLDLRDVAPQVVLQPLDGLQLFQKSIGLVL